MTSELLNDFLETRYEHHVIDAVPLLYFIIPYYQQYEHGIYVKLYDGR